MEFATGMELAKGLSDLLIVLACIPTALYVNGKATSEKNVPLERLWLLTLLLLAAAALMGAALHGIIFFSDITFRCYWAVLYLVMVAAVFLLDRAVVTMYERQGLRARARIISTPWFAALFAVACAGIRLATGRNTILIFIAYGFIILVHIIILALHSLKENPLKGPEPHQKTRRGGGPFATLLTSMIPLALAVVCQALFGDTGVFPNFPVNGAVLAHIFIIISVALLAKCAVQSVQQEVL